MKEREREREIPTLIPVAGSVVHDRRDWRDILYMRCCSPVAAIVASNGVHGIDAKEASQLFCFGFWRGFNL